MMKKKRKENMKIRVKMVEYGLTQYDLSKILGVSEMTVYRRLREELPKKEQARICRLIEESAKLHSVK